MEKFCWVCVFDHGKYFCGYDFGYVRIYLLCMDMQEIFVGYLGRVGLLIVHGYEKKIGSCVWTCEKF